MKKKRDKIKNHKCRTTILTEVRGSRGQGTFLRKGPRNGKYPRVSKLNEKLRIKI